ncbi:ribonuclease H-like domain-containing protein [Demetria terragena]|uniref:ribonuclease H-like domain-containing protein n=1 Tax=Demetria terragena TaxID=63959 RepID=UPI00036092A4|nr:ribonuclease H-like domain-containing protein [Demetria terragena]
MTRKDEIALGGYPAKKCPRATHNEFDPNTATVPAEVAPEVQRLFDAGHAFEVEVIAVLTALHDEPSALLNLGEAYGTEAERATLAAMKGKAPLIVGGRLPTIDGRRGAPDLLIRWRDGYLPADAKNHRTLKRGKGAVTVSALSAPGDLQVLEGYSDKGKRWRDDVMQLAHYTRMLQSLGMHPGGADAHPETLIGAIVGTNPFDEITGEHWGFTWYDLTTQDQETYSASAPTHRAKRSALERYDHEFGFRLEVAKAARQGRELVRPIGVPECDTCMWLDYCASVVPADDASFGLRTGRLNAREWLHLYPDSGEFSMADLAAVDLDKKTQGFEQHSVNTARPAERLAHAVRRARMTVEGLDFEPLGEASPQIPEADIEVDFDIEWDADQRIYQWGIRIREAQDEETALYEPIVSFDLLDAASEVALAQEAAARIERAAQEAKSAGKSFAIYHWSHVEISKTRKFPEMAAALEGRTLDLYKWFGAHYFALGSSSIKSVATALGFRWGVDDPGGFASIAIIETARAGGRDGRAAREWCLRYNESDVAAQAAVRDGLRRLGVGIEGQSPIGRQR